MPYILNACSTLLLVPTFFTDKWKRPSEDIHEVGEPIGVRGAIELPDVHYVVFILQHSSWKEWGFKFQQNEANSARENNIKREI